jgi:hypothetical protein
MARIRDIQRREGLNSHTNGDEGHLPDEHKTDHCASDNSQNTLHNGSQSGTSKPIDFLGIVAQVRSQTSRLDRSKKV